MRLITILLAIACGGSQVDESTTASNEPSPDEPVHVVEGGIVGLGLSGDANADPNGPPAHVQEDEQSANRRRADAQRESERRAEFEAECGGIAIVAGLPLDPPSTPSSPALQSLEPTYRNSVVQPPTPPPPRSLVHYNEWARTTFSVWVDDFSPKIRALEQGAASLGPAERPIGAVWIAHSYAVFSETLANIPPPDEIANDPELLSVYRDAIRTQLRPLIERAKDILHNVPPSDPTWQSYVAQLQTWLEQEHCAQHPGAP